MASSTSVGDNNEPASKPPVGCNRSYKLAKTDCAIFGSFQTCSSSKISVGCRSSHFSQPKRSIISTTAPMLFNIDRKSTRLNSSHVKISYAVFCLKKKHHHQYNITD